MNDISQLLGGQDFDSLSDLIKSNIRILYFRLKQLEAVWGKRLTITSGLRSMEHQIDVYKINAAKMGKVFSLGEVPMHSKHLTGEAADILDNNHELYNWCKNNEQALINIGLWCEDDISQPRLHVQTSSPSSGHRWFLP